MDAIYVLVAAVAAPIVVVQLSRVVSSGRAALLVLAVVAGLGVAAEGRHRGYTSAEVAAATACTVLFSFLWSYPLALAGLLVAS